MSTLYIVATPIGNLEDITLRALRVLREVDVVFAEDTREAKKLLSHFEMRKEVERYDEHSHEKQSERILELLLEGKNVAYVSDAGTPGISDPGARLVAYVGSASEARDLHQSISITPIPGASALTTLLSVSGLTGDHFEFRGFGPHKKGRQTFFDSLENIKHAVAFYESVHRAEKTFAALADRMPERLLVVGRELTKLHESILRGTCREIAQYFSDHADELRGEFVLLLEPYRNDK